LRDPCRVARVRDQPGQGLDQAKPLVSGGQQKHPTVRTEPTAVKRGSDLLAANGWQGEPSQHIVEHGGPGNSCPASGAV
jgi:hypothetical protein